MQLKLSEEGNDEYMGYVNVSVAVIPQTAEEKDSVGARESDYFPIKHNFLF